MTTIPAERIVPAGTVVAAADWRVLMHTPRFAELVGRPGDDLRGEDLSSLLDPVLDTPLPLVDPPMAVHGETYDGRRITLVVEALAGGRHCLSAADVTGATAVSNALKRARRVAESASSAKSRVLATISHELRTPLNAVIGFSDALAQLQPPGQPIPAERVREYANTIREAGLVLLRQINNILDVVRLESGGFELTADVIEVPRLIELAVRQMDTAARQAQVTVAAGPAVTGYLLRGDERRLRQALNHLLTNALKFTPHYGTVALETAFADDGDLLLVVRDSGVGIAEDELDRAFNVFAEGEGEKPSRSPGVGFGLYFCRAVVEAHGGQLTLASRIGVGTSVTLRLPRERLITSTAAPGQLQETP